MRAVRPEPVGECYYLVTRSERGLGLQAIPLVFVIEDNSMRVCYANAYQLAILVVERARVVVAHQQCTYIRWELLVVDCV